MGKLCSSLPLSSQAPFLPHYYDVIGNRTDVRLLNRKLTEMYATSYQHLLDNDSNTTVIVTRAETR